MKLEHPEFYQKNIFDKNTFIKDIINYHAKRLETKEKLYLRDLIEIDFWTDEKIIEEYQNIFS